MAKRLRNNPDDDELDEDEGENESMADEGAKALAFATLAAFAGYGTARALDRIAGLLLTRWPMLARHAALPLALGAGGGLYLLAGLSDRTRDYRAHALIGAGVAALDAAASYVPSLAWLLGKDSLGMALPPAVTTAPASPGQASASSRPALPAGMPHDPGAGFSDRDLDLIEAGL